MLKVIYYYIIDLKEDKKANGMQCRTFDFIRHGKNVQNQKSENNNFIII